MGKLGRAGGVWLVAAAVVLLAGCTPAPLPTEATAAGVAISDPALVALDILPPGNGSPFGGFTSSFTDDQREKYDRLDDQVADGTLTDSALPNFFDDAHLGGGTIVRTDRPRPGVRIEWDDHGVPHVYGDTAADVAFGSGWAVAEARILVAELGRILGRAGAIEMGGNGGDLIAAIGKLGTVTHINYTDAELEQNLSETVAAAGSDGPKIVTALDSFAAGINGWLDVNPFPQQLASIGLPWRHWSRDDVLAVGIVVDDIFGAGGGDEVGNAAAWDQLAEQFGATTATTIYDQLRLPDDPTATPNINGRFDYPQFASVGGGAPSVTNVIDPAAVAMPDPVASGASAVVTPTDTPTASNYLAVSAERSKSGHPILVGGPQSSYFSPELLFEMDLHGGGYNARGITFPGLGPWVVIGRSRSYAWTATAGGSDVSDERVERLCETDGSAPTTDSTHYVFDGQCRAMTRPDDDLMTAWRTVHGPVVGRTTVDGAPVAITRQRMSRFQTAQAARAFWTLNQGTVVDAADFAPTMSSIPMSFNWAYVNERDIAYFHSGYYPVRATGVSYEFPSWGTGQWEWKGRLDWHRQPQGINPPSGELVSWNNKVADGWTTADNDWAVGAGQRVDLIAERAAGLHDATPAEVVAAVQDAGTADLRGERAVTAMLAVLAATPAPSAQLDQLRTKLATWAAAGAHRRDRNDDGFYDDPMVPLVDSLFVPLVHTVFGSGLGEYFNEEYRRPAKLDTTPSLTGSAFSHGWYSLVTTDLRRVSGAEASPAGAVNFCGGGDLVTCSKQLWDTLYSVQQVVPQFLKPTILERIRFIPFVTDAASMRWVNRSTYQQVMSFGSR